MARSIISAGLVALIKRKSYSTAAAAGQGISRGKVVESTKSSATYSTPNSASSSWIPDPTTGYYRPANKKGEIDAAEMRARVIHSYKKAQN